MGSSQQLKRNNMELSPYVMFNGNAADAIAFYEKALGAKVLFKQTFGESPAPVSDNQKDKIMHANLEVAGMPFMISDGGENQPITPGDNVHLSLNFHDEKEIDDTFTALSEGGYITMPLADTFWGAKFGMLKDKFGICWMFNYDRPGGDHAQQ